MAIAIRGKDDRLFCDWVACVLQGDEHNIGNNPRGYSAIEADALVGCHLLFQYFTYQVDVGYRGICIVTAQVQFTYAWPPFEEFVFGHFAARRRSSGGISRSSLV